jgi:integrase
MGRDRTPPGDDGFVRSQQRLECWFLNFKPRGGPPYRLSLDRELGRRVESKSEAEAAATTIRAAILAGTFRTKQPTPIALPFRSFADIWTERRGKHLVSAPLDAYRLGTICRFVVPGTKVSFGDTRIDAITVDHIEAFRDARKAQGLSAVSINHDLRLLRKMFNWAVRKGYVERTPFKIGSEPAITLERELPRNKRFQDVGVEQRLLDAANPLLRGVIVAMLDTACRPGEIMSLQWREVNLERRELTIRAEKEKTRRERVIPISSRLLAILEMRRHDPAGREMPAEAYVFGNAIGRRVKSVREAWNNAATKAGLTDFQIRDLRHEAGSRFDEAGMPINYVSNMLGHSNLSTTSRYLNINRRGLHLAMEKFEENRAEWASRQAKSESVAQPLHTADEPPQAVVQHPTAKPTLQ